MARLNLGSLFFRVFADTKGVKDAEKEVDKSAKRMTRSFGRLGTAIKAALSFEVARRAQLIAENTKLLDIRLRAVSDTSQEFLRNQQLLLKIADKTGQAFDGIVVLFEKIKLGTKDIGATNDQILALTDSLNKLGVIGGSSGTEIRFSMRQLSQAFSGGIVRAEEFNSIVENTPAIARAIADGMGLSVGELRKMVIEGNLLSEDVFNAILSQQDAVDARFAQIPRTSSMAWQAVQNQAGQALKQISEEINSSEGISGALDKLADNIQPFTEGMLISFNIIKAGWQVIIAEMIAFWKRLVESVSNANANLVADFENTISEMRFAWDSLTVNMQTVWGISVNSMRRSLAILFDAFATLPGVAILDDIRMGSQGVASGLRSAADTTVILKDKLLQLEKDEDRREFKANMKRAGREAAHNERIAQINTERDAVIEAAGVEVRADVARIEAAAAARKAAAAGSVPGSGEGDTGTVDPMSVLDEEAFQDLMAKFGDQTAQIASAHRKRQEEINKIIGLGAKEREELEKRSAILLQRDMAKLAMTRVASVQSMVDDVIGIIGEGNAKQSALGRAAIGISKGLAIAQAAIALQQNIAEASKIGFPQNLPLIAAAVSQGTAIITTLRGTPEGPGRVNGGSAVGGFATPVVESGAPEIFENARGRFIIPGNGQGGQVSPMDTAASSGKINVTIINNGDPVDAEVTFVTREELQIELSRSGQDTVNTINTSLANGSGDTFDALRRGAGIQRNVR